MNDTAAPRRGLRIRWWMWLIAIAVLLLTIACGLHWNGQTAWRRACAAIAASGQPVDAAGLLAIAPPVDQPRQERLWRAVQDLRGAWTEPGREGLPFRDLDTPTADPTREPAQRAKLAAGAADMATLCAILDEGPVEISSLGWIDRGRIAADGWQLDDAIKLRAPPLMGMRAAANWLAGSAVFADDPTGNLVHLDALVAAMHRPGILIDGMIAIAIAAIRDQGYLYLATRGRLSPADIQRWASVPCDGMVLVADSMTGERCLFLTTAVGSGAAHLVSVLGHTGWRAASDIPLAWLFMHRAAACAAADSLACERTLRRTAPVGPLAEPDWSLRIGPAQEIMYVGNGEFRCTAVESASLHRLQLVAGCIAQHYRATRELPADNAALAALLPMPLLAQRSPDEPALLYERLGSSRFRVGIDPHGRLPPSIPPDRWTAKPAGFYQSNIGSPPAAKAWWQTRWSLEIDLDAILVPAAPPRKRASTPAAGAHP